MGEGKEGRGLGNMGSWSPRGAALKGGAHRLLTESWRPGRGVGGTIKATPRELSETRSGCYREP